MLVDASSAVNVARLSTLAEALATARRGDVGRLDVMFKTLGTRLANAKVVERELDRRLANRFNVLSYLRTDELGLSRIVADLLDPHGTHGQGTYFLKRLLGMIGSSGMPGGSIPTLDSSSIRVTRERATDDLRRLDISVELLSSTGDHICIAIENKPYAADGETQVQSYLEFLRCNYRDQFLLIYLSPHGGRPSIDSLPTDAPIDGLATMAYCPHAENVTTDPSTPRLSFSLADWLNECWRSCAVDRLRWFLRDAENFCHSTFGGAVITSSEQKEIRNFILASDENAHTALSVFNAWPQIRDEIVRAFLATLCAQLECDLATADDADSLQLGSTFLNRPRQDGVWAYRESWMPDADSRPYVWLGHGGHASGWWIGVGFDPRDSGSTEIELLKKPLALALRGGRPDHDFPWYRYLDDCRDWSALLFELHEESREPGRLIDYFSEHFHAVAKKAVPIIDELLRAGD